MNSLMYILLNILGYVMMFCALGEAVLFTKEWWLVVVAGIVFNTAGKIVK